MQCEEPNYSLFSTVQFPEHVIAPKYRNGIGRSVITSHGLMDKIDAEDLLR